MFKKRYVISFLFLFLVLIPFNVSSEQLTERVIIIFNHEIDYSLLENKEIEVHHLFEEMDAASVTIPAEWKDSLLERANIQLIEPDPEVKTTAQIMSWGYHSLGLEQFKQTGFTGKGVKIGILDTGARIDHPDLRIAGGAVFVQGASSYQDDNGHGSHVAGIIAAQDNAIGAIGVAPDAEIYAVKVLDKKGEGNQSDVVKGIEWAMAQGLDIINLSITSQNGSYLLEEALKRAESQGIIAVAASGNYPTALYRNLNVLYPARYPTVLGVGSVTWEQNHFARSLFSYFGQDLDFVAPGEEIYSTYNGTGQTEYGELTGTSMASPFVAGMAALYMEAYPNLNSKQIKIHMEKSAEDLGAQGKDMEYGYGLVQPPFSKDVVNVFPDVADDSWYTKEVSDLFMKGIISGNKDGNFNPYSPITRAEAVTMIGRALNYSGIQAPTKFSDVPSGHFASGYINSTTEAGVITGFLDGSFRPNLHIIRGDVAVILQRAFGLPDATSSHFSDVADQKHYFNAINSLAEQQITQGYEDGSFKPDLNITRAQFSVFLSKAITKGTATSPH
ncbi:S8 family peptidase [Bacillus tuaregi]|uniref:S8 family peptidase n=1 Tax=Bacillus tuaregi TaxID=1816695 RepID=UPI0008F8D2A6|nr:S8 family serine peptidase [Bacillus tuaregi]